ncbi:MAG: hypothetical protein F2667_06785 [Actinobacteria bacterium]|nr:hypothetical protein [Actinomycetota bacterium]
MNYIVDAPPHPQAIFVGWDETDARLPAMTAQVADHLILPDVDLLAEERLQDWDILVIRDGHPISIREATAAHLHVLAFNAVGTGFVTRRTPDALPRRIQLTYDGEVKSPTMTHHSPKSWSPQLAQAIATDLEPWLRAQPIKPSLRSTAYQGSLGTQPGFRVEHLIADADATPWMLDADDHIIAGQFFNAKVGGARGEGEWWCLPHDSEQPHLWLTAAIAAWRVSTPDRFVDLPNWYDDPEWETTAERAARSALSSLAADRARALEEFAIQEDRLTTTLREATAAAADGHRRLLTSQGPELVAAVIEALTALGYEVTDADARLQAGDRKLEDLNLSDPDAPSWLNITEIKGYGNRSGKTSDLIPLTGRYSTAYRARTGHAPNSRWYIINQKFETAPSSRPTIFAGAADDIAEFALENGLAIDTRDLFKLVTDVEAGTRTAADVRKLLKSQTGVLQLTATTDVDAE